MKNSIRSEYEKFHQNLKNEMTNLTSILTKGSNYELENFMLENFPRNFGHKLANFVVGEDFMEEISKAANEAGKSFSSELKTTPQRAVYDFYTGAVLTVVMEHALYAKAAEVLGGE
jgi:hypothetical protein